MAGRASKKKVVVIGAGVSGLAAARAFIDKGHAVTVIERTAEIGGVWAPSRSYPDVQTQSPKDLYRYTDMAMPEEYPEWPKGPQVHAYLESYAKAHGLTGLIRHDTTVEKIARGPGGKGWVLGLKAGKAAAKDEAFDFVAVATGQFSEKNVLEHPGQDAFVKAGGMVVHSSDYCDSATAKGRDVLVLGFSKSATDIAVNAAQSGARSVTIVYRQNMWRIPYFIGGINFKRILYVRKQEQMFPGWRQSTAGRIGRVLGKPLIWANWRALEALLNFQLGLKKLDLKPKFRIEDTVNCSVPIVTPGLFEAIRAGKIRCVQGSIDSYDGGAVVLTTGERVKSDLVVQAVGWKLGVPFLPADLQAKLVEPDGQYKLFRLIANPDLPDMGFVGFNSSFCTVLCADLAAHWLVRYADGQLARQPTEAEMRADIGENLRWRREVRTPAQVYGGLCVAPYHFLHFDDLMQDMGAKRWRRGPLAENFTPPDAAAYGRFLETVPEYRAA